MRRLPLAIFLCLLALTVRASATDTSITGLSLKMSPDEIKDKLGPDYKLSQTVNIQRGAVFNFVKGEEGYNILTLGTRVVYIEHQQAFGKGEEIGVGELAKALKAKYGEPSVADGAGDEPETWVIANDGSLMTAAAHGEEAHACGSYELKGPFFQSSGKTNFDFNFPAIPVKDGLAECGIVIQARPIHSADNPGLVTKLTVSVFDARAAQDWFKEEMAEYNKGLNDAVEAAKKNKPNL